MKTCETSKKSQKNALLLSIAKKYLTNRPLLANRAKLWILVRTKLNPNLSHSHFKLLLLLGYIIADYISGSQNGITTRYLKKFSLMERRGRSSQKNKQKFGEGSTK